MNSKPYSIKNILHPLPNSFGETLKGNDELYFSEKLIIMHANEPMLRHTIGDGMPYRLRSPRIGLYTQGCMDSQVNLEDRHVSKGTLEFFGSDTLFQLNDASPDLHTYEVIFSPTYLADMLGGTIPQQFRVNASSFCIEIAEKEQEKYLEMIRLLLFLAQTEGEESPVTRSMSITLLRYTHGLFQKYMKRDTRRISRQEAIFHEFANMVAQSHGLQRRHGYYAEQLNVSEHYLSLAVKKSSGITAKEWIDRMVMTEIKMQLVHSNQTIAQIADRLDFPSDSFLCKFFRRHTGMSPIEFRKVYNG